MVEFNRAAFGTKNPEWTKQRQRNVWELGVLADHICTRTPPKSYKTKGAVFRLIVRRNYRALGGWFRGYIILTEFVIKRLIERDGSL